MADMVGEFEMVLGPRYAQNDTIKPVVIFEGGEGLKTETLTDHIRHMVQVVRRAGHS